MTEQKETASMLEHEKRIAELEKEVADLKRQLEGRPDSTHINHFIPEDSENGKCDGSEKRTDG